MDEPGSLFIVPAFDSTKGFKMKYIPRSKKELAGILKLPKSQRRIHEKYHLSYIPQNISYWLKQDNVYDCELSEKDFFEPYFVAHRNIPLYDEVFNGCFQDKLSHVSSLRVLRYKMKMLPDVFIIHLSHKDLKNYVNWCRGYTTGKRFQMRKSSSDAISRELMGFYENTHYPSLFYNSSTPETLQDLCSCRQGLSEKIARERLIVRFLKTITIFLFVLLGAILFSFFRVPKNQNRIYKTK